MVQRDKKEQAIKLRLSGKSYGEILRELNIPSKGTLSFWFKGIKLPLEAKKRLRKNILIAREHGLFAFNRKRTKLISIENDRIVKKALREVGALSRRELLLVGAALYWGEGAKIGKNNNAIILSNSDPCLINLFLRFIREILAVDENKIRVGIQIHKNLDISKTKEFWSRITNLPTDRFYITQQVSSASHFKRPKRFLPFGTMIVRINSRQLAYRVRGYIDGLSCFES